MAATRRNPVSADPVDPGDAFTLTVLGCDGSWPGPGGAGSGYLIRVGENAVLLDAGPGTFATLQTVIDPAELDAVVVTHHHPDHWTDLYSVECQARFGGRRTPLPVFAPARVAERAGPEQTPTLEWRPVTHGDRTGIGELSCAFHRTDHVEETLAVRVDGAGRALGYSADTGPQWSLTELGSDLDLVLCEATYTAEHEGTAASMQSSTLPVARRSMCNWPSRYR